MQRYGLDSGYPGLEKEQLQPNTGGLRMPAQTPTNSPLAGRQEKPGAWPAGQQGSAAAAARRCLALCVDRPPACCWLA